MIYDNIDIFEKSYKEYVSYFKRLENLEKIRNTNGPSPLHYQYMIRIFDSVTSSVIKSSKNPKVYDMWCQYYEKNNQRHNTADYRAIIKIRQQKNAYYEAKAGPRKKSLDFHFGEINALKKQLKPENTAINKNRKAYFLLSYDINGLP
jgi:hypothetical protein